MSERPPVSVVVPTRNRAHLLPELLAALAAQDYPEYEVIVVDDASDDETPALLAAWAGERRRVRRAERPAGSYAARNVGWRAAQGTLVAFTDDDCLPQPGWLSALVAAAPGAIAAQGVTLARPGEITPFTHQIEQTQPGPPYRTCNMAYWRTSLERLGGFEGSLRWYADNILGLRARELGPVAFAPQAIVHHPPRPKEWRTREAWQERFRADARHRAELQRLRAEPVRVPGGALPVVLWVLRPLVKQTMSHLRYVSRHPRDYLRNTGPMVREKRELLIALREYWAERYKREVPVPANDPDGAAPEIDYAAGHVDGARSAEELVSVVIVTRDRPAMLAGVLESLQGQTWPRREVIVVDHEGGGETGRVADSVGARCVSSAGTTLAAARQAGIDAAQGDIVAFVDDDCLPDAAWLEGLVGALRHEPVLLGVQGRTEAERGPVGSRAIQVLSPNALYQTCNIAYRRDALRRAGGCDLRFAGWFEDTALAARVLEHGPLGFAPGAVVTHRAMPRRPRDRRAWGTLLTDERRLARDYPTFYRRVRGPGFPAVVIARWLVGSPLKKLTRELPRAFTQPAAYLALARSLAAEQIELVRALLVLSEDVP